MFTGIIESTGKVINTEQNGSNITYTLQCSFANELTIDQSLAHDGCCLTVEYADQNTYKVTAIAETLEKSSLRHWKIGSEVNLERCLKLNDRLDGHIVQGHVDQTGIVKEIRDKDGSFLITITHDAAQKFVTVPQGSVTVNGISLTVADSKQEEFTVAIIPYTWQFTNPKNLQVGSVVNLEFDIVGKYITKLMSANALQ